MIRKKTRRKLRRKRVADKIVENSFIPVILGVLDNADGVKVIKVKPLGKCKEGHFVNYYKFIMWFGIVAPSTLRGMVFTDLEKKNILTQIRNYKEDKIGTEWKLTFEKTKDHSTFTYLCDINFANLLDFEIKDDIFYFQAEGFGLFG